MNSIQPVPTLNSLPRGLQQDGAISIELDGGVPVFRASQAAQDRVERLLEKQKNSQLTPGEEQELRQYEDVDDYLSYLNRHTRNLLPHLMNTKVRPHLLIANLMCKFFLHALDSTCGVGYINTTLQDTGFS